MQRLPLALPNYGSSCPTGQVLSVSVVSADRDVQANYTFGILGNKLWVGPCTQWTHCDLTRVLSFIYCLAVLYLHANVDCDATKGATTLCLGAIS